MRVKALLALSFTLAALNVFGQLVDPDPDWKEVEVPPPPTFKTDALVFVEMPRYVSVKVGVDPETLRITPDGIVRYVIVASSAAGSMNASYEGIRCSTGEVKTYARYSANGKWIAVGNAEWIPLNNNQRSMHALALARQGACEGRSAAAQSAAAIIYKLKNPSPESNR